MEDYKPNSNKYKQEQKNALENEKRASKIVTNPVKTQQKSGVEKFMGKFIVEDLKSVASHIVTDTLIPGAKKVLYDMFTGGLSSLLFGGRGNPAPGGTNVAGRVAYRDFYSGNQYQTPVSPRAATTYDYNEIIFSTRADAVDVLTRMDELIAKYRVVRVADLYDLVGMTCNYTDNRYGWTNLASADVVPVRDGFMIRLPKAMPID